LEAIWRRRRCRKLFNTLYCCCCYCLKWLGLFSLLLFFMQNFFANLPCTSFVYLMLSLSHTRSRSLYGSLCSLALVLRSRSLAHVKFYSFIPIFFSCSCCKTKIQHISFVAFSFRYNFIEFKCIKNWKLPSVSWLHLKSA